MNLSGRTVLSFAFSFLILNALRVEAQRVVPLIPTNPGRSMPSTPFSSRR